MSLISNKTTELLDRHEVAYHVFHHQTDYTAEQTAADVMVPAKDFAKTVVLRLPSDEDYALAVIPADRQLDLAKAAKALGVLQVSLASEKEMTQRFPDFELGAEPPFGSLCGLRVVLDQRLAEAAFITFNAGTHNEAVRVAYADYLAIERPAVADLIAVP